MDKYFLLDVRTPEEFEEAHIEGSVNIPMHEIPDNLERIKGGKPVLIICRSGARAHAVQDFLVGRGIRSSKVLEGGILEHGTQRKIYK